MRHLLAPIVLAAALAGCGQPKQLFVDQAWVRLAAVPGSPAAAYFRLNGGPTDNVLLTVTTEVAIKSELHETASTGGAMTMRPIQRVALPADSELSFAPGGKHVMLFNVNPGIKAGSRVPLVFTFVDGLRIEYNARAIAAGDPPPEF